MPCERPMVGVSLCSKARRLSATSSPSTPLINKSAARTSCTLKQVSSTSEEVSMQERIRDFHVGFPRLWIPRRTNFVIVLNDVLIGAVEGNCECSAGATGRAFETSVGRDHVVSKNAAIAPATDSHAVGIGDTHRNHVIDSGD